MLDLLSREPGSRVSDRDCRTGPAIGWDRVKHTIVGTFKTDHILYVFCVSDETLIQGKSTDTQGEELLLGRRYLLGF